MPICDPALGQIVGREFQRDTIARQHPNPVAAQLSGEMSEYGTFLIQLDTKKPAGEFFDDRPGDFDAVFFTHQTALADILSNSQDGWAAILRAELERVDRVNAVRLQHHLHLL